MKIRKIPVDADLTPTSLDYAVEQYVKEFQGWPRAVISAAVHREDGTDDHAKRLGLSWFCLPSTIALDCDAWAVVGADGEAIWSPGV